MSREIIYSKDFDKAVDKLGGYRSVDRAIDTVLDGLRRDPYGFNKFENDHLSFRYAITKPIEEMPALAVVFVINTQKDVILEHVEEYQDY